MRQLKFLISITVLTVLAIMNVNCSERGPVITFTVDTTTDGADANPGDGLSDDGAGNCTLRAAIQETNAMPGHDTISLPAGIYTLSLTDNGESAATGDIDITDDLTILGDGAGTTIIDGGNQFRVFLVSSDITVKISGATIQNGSAEAGGGGISNSGTLTLTDTIIDGNMAQSGGGIYNSSTGNLTIINSTVSDNTASSAGGIFNEGGMLSIDDTVVSGNSAYSSGGIRNSGTVTITDSTVSDNTSECAGGGLDNKSGGTATIISSSFIGNDAPHGGGVANDGGDADITDSIVSGNTASSDGGGILNMPGCMLTITNSTISDNTSNAAGGINNAGNLTVIDSTISGNNVEWAAGGIANSGTLIIRNSTLSGNRAPTSGAGAIWNSGGSMTMTNCTVSGNEADNAAGVLNYSVLAVTNSTFSDNTANFAADILNDGGSVTLKNTIVAGSNDPSFGGDPLEPGTGNLTDCEIYVAVPGFTLVDNIRLGPLADNGGPTQTHALMTGSPAIDAGDDSVCPETDQRGITRPRDGDDDGAAHCDVGAFEY